MDVDIRKQGVMYLLQQRFGKKWKRVWCVLYRESSCSISRLEFFEYKDGVNVEKNKSVRKQQEHKKVVRLSDCVRVTESPVADCPRNSRSFLLETSTKIYVFAAEPTQMEEWTHTLCELAFPMRWLDEAKRREEHLEPVRRTCGEHVEHVRRVSMTRGKPLDHDEQMEENCLYAGRNAACDFKVCVRRTEASDRCKLKGDVILRAESNALQLLELNGAVRLLWPYRYLRRFGRDKSTFSFEAGRRCDSGEGCFEFDTRQGNLLFQAVDAAIKQHRVQLARQTSRLEPADSVYSVITQHRDQEQQFHPLACLDCLADQKSQTVSLLVPRKHRVKMMSSCPLPGATQDPLSDAMLEPSSGTTLDPLLGVTLDPPPGASLDSLPGLIWDFLPGAIPDPPPGAAPEIPPNPADMTYSQVALEKNPDRVALLPPTEPGYSLPFDVLEYKHALGNESDLDPIYNSIEDMRIGTVTRPTYARVEHIYDEPADYAMRPRSPRLKSSPVYDNPEEMRGDAWMIMGTPSDPKGHEFPYNPIVDDYAVPKRLHRAKEVQEEGEREEEGEGEVKVKGKEGEREREMNLRDSPYNNVMVKVCDMRK